MSGRFSDGRYLCAFIGGYRIGGMMWKIFGNKIRSADMMLFEFKFGNKHSSILIQKYPDILKYEGLFSIRIGTKFFFEDAHFCIFEFLSAIQSWLDNHEYKMIYNTVETDDTPILEFSKQETGMWKISSVWQEFDCKQEFEKEDIVSSLNKMLLLAGIRKEFNV